MANLEVTAGKRGGRRSLDSEINMIPMIDLLIVTIAFLLITAEWTLMARIDADAQVPGAQGEESTPPPEKELHVNMRSADRFVLMWKQGPSTIESIDVPRRGVPVAGDGVEAMAFPDLAARIAEEWKTKGQHTNPMDPRHDVAVLHVDDHTEFKELVGAMDAIRAARRRVRMGSKVESVAAFDTVFSVQ
jgi:biopolymer transport protein ExbD